ncbi:MAG TPA: tRNA epoxyqueuosine(34) reductase QueG [Polyangiaceae bacterium]|nr:tRNA epoxyqueuosine(34) reductase QueG [Polyangiaceae bacterium]
MNGAARATRAEAPLGAASAEEELPPGVRRHLPGRPSGSQRAPAELARAVRARALELGFVRVGFSPVERLADAEARLSAWLQAGYHGQMAYLAGAASRADPRALLGEARSLIVVALPYPGGPEADPEALVPSERLRRSAATPKGFIARYARGADYHLVIKDKLRALADHLADLSGGPVLARPCVDTAPLLERDVAVRAGVGFAAKNTLTIVPGAGSYVLLGELLSDVEIAPDAPIAPGCGSCRACLDACPTAAFVDAHVLDARRCISYLTIELQGPMPRELRPLVGQRVFGCDACQEVCPYNAAAARKRSAPELAAHPALAAPDLIDLLELGSAAYKRLVAGTALRRVNRAQLARNAAVALGNAGDPRSIPPLVRALGGHPSPLVRGHAAWALGRLGSEQARAALERALAEDGAPEVREEARLALAELATEA